MIEVVLEFVLFAIWYAVAGPIVSAFGATLAVLKKSDRTWTEHFIAFYKLFPDYCDSLSETKKSWFLGLSGILVVLGALFVIGWIARSI